MPKRDHYFTSHWLANHLPELPALKLQAAERFLAPLLAQLPSGTVLDVGTGDGAHLQRLQHAASQLTCVGLDISPSALAICRYRAPHAMLLRADANALPLPDQRFDAAFSYGVLAYLADPWRGLAEMVRVTKPGGMIGLWMYPETPTILGRTFALVRRIVPHLPRFLQARVADIIVPFLGLLPTASGLNLGNASWSACREVILVNIAPPHLTFPSRDAIMAQLEALGCRVVHEDKTAPITVWAVTGDI